MKVVSSLIDSSSSLSQILSTSRGGAISSAVLSSAVLRATTSISGGSDGEGSLIPKMTPEATSVLLMSIAMSMHYLGYALARPVTVALFTSSSTGYAGLAGAFPFAMAFVSPMSLLLLYIYGQMLDKHEAHGTMIRSTLLCAAVMVVSGVLIASFQRLNVMVGAIPAVKLVTGPLFVFREAYVQLLTSQFWSFMASTLTPCQSKRWFAPIAGLTSISSALSGICVTAIVQRVGLSGALVATAVALLGSLVFASMAYDIAHQFQFEPEQTSASTHSEQHASVKNSLVDKALHLFQRVPILRSLFFEILASQGLATILNIVFVASLSRAIPNDTNRAGFVGMVFSAINLVTMVLQFGLLPRLVFWVGARNLWRFMPLLPLAFTTFQSTFKSPSLNVVTASFMIMKVLEYSVRRMLDEMIYVPLDYESRFLGKEVIGVFGYRFGKSLMSLGLSAFTSLVGTVGEQQTSFLSCAVSFLWFQTAWGLSKQVPTSEEADEAYEKTRKPNANAWVKNVVTVVQPPTQTKTSVPS